MKFLQKMEFMKKEKLKNRKWKKKENADGLERTVVVDSVPETENLLVKTSNKKSKRKKADGLERMAVVDSVPETENLLVKTSNKNSKRKKADGLERMAVVDYVPETENLLVKTSNKKSKRMDPVPAVPEVNAGNLANTILLHQFNFILKLEFCHYLSDRISALEHNPHNLFEPYLKTNFQEKVAELLAQPKVLCQEF